MKVLSKKSLLLSLLVALVGFGTVGVVRAAQSDVGTSRTNTQGVKTFSSTITYNDIKSAPRAVGNDSTFTLGSLPANIVITSAFVNVPSAFYVNNDPASNTAVGIQILDAGGALGAGGGALNNVGVSNKYNTSGSMAAPFDDVSTVQIQFHANDSSDTGGIPQLTSGKATIYITYLPYKTY